MANKSEVIHEFDKKKKKPLEFKSVLFYFGFYPTWEAQKWNAVEPWYKTHN